MHAEETQGGEWRVWLSAEDIDALLDLAGHKDPQRELAYALAARSGLRSEEITDVTPQDLHHDEVVGWMLKVPSGKGDKYRETPIPAVYAKQIRWRADDAPTAPVINVTTRTLRNWIDVDRGELAERDGDDRWHKVSMHDLRRSWAGQLKAASADPAIVIEWGGWADMETFLDHYDSASVPEAQRREREDVDWL